jgi:hypothetical protein
MEPDDPSVLELLADYRETCQREGELAKALRSVRMDKARQIAEINHAIGEIGKYNRDRVKLGAEHVDEPEYSRSMREAAEKL